MENFDSWFEKATGKPPYPYQRRLADADETGGPLPVHIDIPTGCGKTAAIILAWLWRRRFHPDPTVRQSTPKRLVYCLPMRVLVEQTRNSINKWLGNLGLSEAEAGDQDGKSDSSDPQLVPVSSSDISVHVLMGGEIDNKWDRHPEREAILVGTQDQLLSRALNRGYAMSRARWPMHFGLLNNDCLWVMDEVQLMGTGLATTLQLDAFRHNGDGTGLGHYGTCRSVWMSATLNAEWLVTVDHPKPSDPPLSLSESERIDVDSGIGKCLHANKILSRAESDYNQKRDLAREIIAAHERGTLTLVIVNKVKRAIALYDEIEKQLLKKDTASEPSTPSTEAVSPNLVLLHSRFREADRKKHMSALLSKETRPGGLIVVSTQVVEAGVDVSAKTLFTELAPWSSLIQRFGRCNRYGDPDEARIFWVDVPEKDAPPYEAEHLQTARADYLEALEGRSVAPIDLPSVEMTYESSHVIRRKDVIELFDTTPDLAGNDLDVSRYIRESDDHDVQVFWRELDGEAPKPGIPAPHRAELCSVPIGDDFKKYIKGKTAYRWNFLTGQWERVSEGAVYPGQVYLLDVTAGGYTPTRGWDGESREPVESVPIPEHAPANPSYDGDSRIKQGSWQTIAEHSEEVSRELELILPGSGVDVDTAESLLMAARWHDRGKGHEIFQKALPPDDSHPPGEWAKAIGRLARYERRHFRHELASALAMIQEDKPDLAAYLAAAHHGKVRLSIRSLPDEAIPDNPDIRFARGNWDGDDLPEVDLGGGVKAGAVSLTLEPMELGLSTDGKPSWAERMLKLRDDPNLGPFRLSFLEALLRAADWRASSKDSVGLEAESMISGVKRGMIGDSGADEVLSGVEVSTNV